MDQMPSNLVEGPYGFYVVLVFCLFWVVREFRKARQTDVEAYKRRAEHAETKATLLDTKINDQVRLLEGKIEALQREIQDLRERHFIELEHLSTKYYAARQMLISLGVPTQEIP